MVVLLEWVPVVWFLGLVGTLDGDCELWTGSFSWGNAQLLCPGAGCLGQGGTYWIVPLNCF